MYFYIWIVYGLVRTASIYVCMCMCAGEDSFTPADYKCVIISFILGMNRLICLRWIFLHHNKTDTHIHRDTLPTLPTECLASVLFTPHCQAHGNFFDWQVIWSNHCRDYLCRTSLRIVLLSSSSGSALRGWNITLLVVLSHYRNEKTTEKLLERWALWSNCHSRESRALSPKVGKVSLRLPFQAKVCVWKCVCTVCVSPRVTELLVCHVWWHLFVKWTEMPKALVSLQLQVLSIEHSLKLWERQQVVIRFSFKEVAPFTPILLFFNNRKQVF